MTELIGLPMDDPSTWTAWASVLTLFVLVLSAGFAFAQVRQARALRRDQTRPYVILDFEADQSLLDLVIRNIGQTPASDVKFSFEPGVRSTLDASGRPDRADWFILREGIPFLPPGREYRLLLDVGHRRSGAGLPSRYEVDVAYSGGRRSRYKERQVLDMSPIWGMEQVRRKSLHEIAQYLEKIHDDLQRIQRSFPDNRVSE